MTVERIYGIHAVAQRLRQAPGDCIELICVEQPNARLRDLIALAQAANIEVKREPREALDKLSDGKRHQGCILETRRSASRTDWSACLAAINERSLFLILDGVQDPHNLGACLRSADAAGVDAVIIPRQRAARLTASVRKVAAGAAESVPLLEVANIARSLDDLKQAGVWIYGACGEAAESIYQQRFEGPVALVMGGEGSGLRRLTREGCDHLVSLPMRGRVESLNVSVATGICLYEIQRARGACESS
jgi:23S rRNA (guanosine2251-2'-O)-methyltransferase